MVYLLVGGMYLYRGDRLEKLRDYKAQRDLDRKTGTNEFKRKSGGQTKNFVLICLLFGMLIGAQVRRIILAPRRVCELDC